MHPLVFGILSSTGFTGQAGRWMRVDGKGRGVDADKLASRLRFSTEFAHKVADEIAPGTTVIVTDVPVGQSSGSDAI